MSNLDLLDKIVLALSLACVWPYACRCNWLNWVRYKWQVVSFNLALSTVVLFSIYHGATGTAGPENLAGAAGAALWIVVTWPTWRAGPPEYAERPRAKVLRFVNQFASNEQSGE